MAGVSLEEIRRAEQRILSLETSLLMRDRPRYSQRTNYVYWFERVRALHLLIAGSVLGMFGFFFAAWIGLAKFFLEVELDPAGNHFKSGNNYFPQTVSEMIHDTDSAEGTCFKAFVVAGGFLILMSWYPWNLRGVYVGEHPKVGRLSVCGTTIVSGLSWPALRQFLPPIGMILVATVPCKPAPQCCAADFVNRRIHIISSVVALGGYIVVEVHALYMAHMGNDKPNIKTDGKPWRSERFWRWVLVVCALISAVTFALAGLVVSFGSRYFCCADTWSVAPQYISARNQTSIFATECENTHMKVSDTASGVVLLAKQVEFSFEVITGLLVLASHIAIWYFDDAHKEIMSIPDSIPEPTRRHYDNDISHF